MDMAKQKLTHSERNFYHYLQDGNGNKDIATMAKENEVSDTRIYGLLKILSDKGYVEVQRFKKTQHKVTVL